MRNRNAFFAGIFIVASIVGATLIIISLKGAHQLFEPMQQAAVGFKLTDDIGGLQVGDEVRLGGARVGLVQAIEFVNAPATQPSIRVRFSLPKRFVLHPDADVAIQSTVTGVSVLNFTSLGDGVALADGAELIGKPSALNALFGVGQDLGAMVRDVRSVTLPKVNGAVDATHTTIESYHRAGDEATSLIVDAHKQVEPVVQKYYGVADAAKIALDAVGSLFGDTKTDFRTTLANVSSITANLKEKVPGLLQHVDVALNKTIAAIDDTRVALQDVQKVATNTTAISQSVRQIVQGNRGKIEAVIAALKTTGDNLKGASAEVRRSPWRLLYKPAPGEMANLNLYDSARQFSEGASELNETATALRDLSQDPKADPAEVKKLLQRLDDQFKAFDQVEQSLWKQVRQ